MQLPIQAPPTIRKVSTAKVLDMMAGVNPSESELQRNLKLQCDLCCEITGGNCPSYCVCKK